MIRQQSANHPFETSPIRSEPRVRFSLQQSSQSPSKIKITKSLLLKSKNLSQQYKYLKYDLQGNTQLIDQPKQLQPAFSYQKVHLQQNDQPILGQNLNWSKDLRQLSQTINTKQKIVMKSIKKLWEKNYRPHFFDSIEQTKGTHFQYHTHELPQCIYELNHLSLSHSKFLFLTQDFSENGLYRVILNQDGRYRLMTVNDLVPVNDQTNEHIWGIEEPWKMILLKVWACLNQGYQYILKSHQPFKFLEYFTGNNWKYYNLEREGSRWIDRFKDLLDVTYIVLQTKNSQNIQKIGLVPHSAAYSISNIHSDSERGVQIQVKSLFKHKWKGKLNMVNYKQKLWKEEGRDFMLEKNFLLTKDEFLNVFCCAYMTSLSKSSSHVTDYVQITVPKNSKNAVYLKFSVKNEGFLDFSFIQSYKNKISFESPRSKIEAQKYHKQTGRRLVVKKRFLKCKYMLIRSLKGSNKPLQSRLSRIRSKNELGLTRSSRFEAYEVEYLRGYNKGEAHFLMMQAGDYYFRLKSQTVNQDSVYYLNYCCSEKLEISEEIIQGEERQEILQNCILSLLPASSILKLKTHTIYSGNKFQDMGYGFIVIENTTHTQKKPQRVSFRIDTHLLELQGYKIKGKQYQHPNKPYIITQIQPHSHLVLILKTISTDPSYPYVWPPNSIRLFQPHQIQS